MPPKLKIVAEEILMCGLKSMPVAGKAFEVIDADPDAPRHAGTGRTVGGDRAADEPHGSPAP